MRKLSEINEGLWKSGVERAKSGTKREEDKLHSNIENLKPVDIGVEFYFADEDLNINGVYEFTWEEANEYKDLFKKHGWRLPDYNDFRRIDFDNKHTYRWKKDEQSDLTYVFNIYFPNLTKSTYHNVYFEQDDRNTPWSGWMTNSRIKQVITMEYWWCAHFEYGASFSASSKINGKRRIRLIRDR